MPRANRYFMPGYVWHITHRCHKREFLLKFARTRQRYLHWLYQARRRFAVEILNYAVTSNHIHLIVRNRDRGGENAIPDMMQLVAGRTAQEYNARKGRKGAFWEDRYHATAIETGRHLQRCLTYVDLNMVRAGVVRHPEEWHHGGYHEIQGKKRRNTIIDLEALAEVLEIDEREELRTAHREWVAAGLREEVQKREDIWSQSLAVGSAEFVRQTQLALGQQGRYRSHLDEDGVSALREAEENYGPLFGDENKRIRA